MASRRYNRNTAYRTYGSVAYAPAYEGSAVRAPGQEEVLQPKPQPKARPRVRERILTRTQVQVRPAGAVSVLAVAGFLVVAAFAALLLFSYTQYAVATDQVVSLRSELQTLQAENATLTAQYEKVFDLERIQAAVGTTMVRPTAGQIEYIDLSEPDSVEIISEHSGGSSILGLLQSLKNGISDAAAYFR